MKKINIKEDFSRIPGGRFRSSGKHSAEEFREDLLEPLFVGTDEKIEIDLGGTVGISGSFLEEAFGGLARIYSKEEVLERLVFKSKEQPYLINNVIGCIQGAGK